MTKDPTIAQYAVEVITGMELSPEDAELWVDQMINNEEFGIAYARQLLGTKSREDVE